MGGGAALATLVSLGVVLFQAATPLSLSSTVSGCEAFNSLFLFSFLILLGLASHCNPKALIL